MAGGLITAFGYTLVFSGKIAALQTTVNNLVTIINKPIILPPEFIEKFSKFCAKADDLERRVNRLEIKNGQ
jgi:hypothetical protein